MLIKKVKITESGAITDLHDKPFTDLKAPANTKAGVYEIQLGIKHTFDDKGKPKVIFYPINEDNCVVICG